MERSSTLQTSDLDAIARVGWVQRATPVTALAELAQALGAPFLGVKRDDAIEALHGGAKIRKLDYALAAPPFLDAPAWASLGGIGSGHLVALTAAAQAKSRLLHAHVFWTPLSPGLVDNLAFVASGPTALSFYEHRATVAMRHPALVAGERCGDVPVVPPGATSARGMLGMVRAGLELAEQIRSGELPEPRRIYVALGSGGCAAGLSVGLALGGVETTIVAVAAVERVLAFDARLRSLQRDVVALLDASGLPVPLRPVPVTIDHAHVGGGYAVPTRGAVAACEAFSGLGIALECVYTGKAMASLLDNERGRGEPVLFWHTARRGPLPHRDDWRDRLPPELARRIADPTLVGRISRRRFVVAGAAALAVAGIVARTGGYPRPPQWDGQVLAAWEAIVIRAAAEALLPPAPEPDRFAAIAARVDHWLAAMPRATRREVHAMLALVEQGTTLLGGGLRRFTDLSAEARERFLDRLAHRGGVLGAAYRGLRDLCMLAYYQAPETWPAIGYDGPRVPLTYDPSGPERVAWPAYDSLVAPPGARPDEVPR